MKILGAMILTGAMGLSGIALGQQGAGNGNGNGNGHVAERVSAGELLGQTGGSLLRASMLAAPDPKKASFAAVSFYSVPPPEPKTIKKHDLVTIIIREETQYSSDGTTDLKKQADLDAKLEEMVKFGGQWPFIQGGAVQPPIPEVKASGTRNFKGEATVDRAESLISRITAEVVDVKPNGTFAIQARKRIKADEEEQEYTLTGVCRAADLTPDNTVLSTQLADLAIERMTKGAVNDTTKRGLIPKLLDFVNPF